MLSFSIAFLLGGLLNRWRGGWLAFPPSHTLRRLGLTLALVGLVGAKTGDPYATAAALLLFPGLLPSWGRWFDMGRMGKDDDLLGMTGRGMVLTGLLGGALALLGHGPWVMLAGATMGPIYWLAWWIHDKVGLRRGDFLDGPTSAAEFVFMGVVFATVNASL